MPLQHGTNEHTTRIKNQRLHRIEREINREVLGVVPLEFSRVVLGLILDDTIAELAPGRQIHPRAVRDHELRRPRGLPFVEIVVGAVGGRDLPLDKAVHAHEGGELFGDKRETAGIEDEGVLFHEFGHC